MIALLEIAVRVLKLDTPFTGYTIGWIALLEIAVRVLKRHQVLSSGAVVADRTVRNSSARIETMALTGLNTL